MSFKFAKITLNLAAGKTFFEILLQYYYNLKCLNEF